MDENNYLMESMAEYLGAHKDEHDFDPNRDNSPMSKVKKVLDDHNIDPYDVQRSSPAIQQGILNLAQTIITSKLPIKSYIPN